MRQSDSRGPIWKLLLYQPVGSHTGWIPPPFPIISLVSGPGPAGILRTRLCRGREILRRTGDVRGPRQRMSPATWERDATHAQQTRSVIGLIQRTGGAKPGIE